MSGVNAHKLWDMTQRTISTSTVFTQLASILRSSSQQDIQGKFGPYLRFAASPSLPIFLRKFFLFISLVLGDVSAYHRVVGKVVIAVAFTRTYISIRRTKTIIRKNTNRTRIPPWNSANILKLTSLVIERTTPTGLLPVGGRGSKFRKYLKIICMLRMNARLNLEWCGLAQNAVPLRVE